MPDLVTATLAPALSARVVQSAPLTLADADVLDETAAEDVHDTSRIVHLVNRDALVTDHADALVLIDLQTQQVRSRTLSRAEADAGEPVLDLETCAPVPGTDGQVLLAFGSGATPSREWIVQIDWRTPTDPPRTLLHEAPEFFERLRETEGFCNGTLNLEGAVFIGDDAIRFFHRGLPSGKTNGPAEGLAEDPVDAAVDVRWKELQFYLKDTSRAPAPTPRQLTRYDFGALEGVRLTFSDATVVRGGEALLYTAAAETDDGVVGSTLGLLDDDGARYTVLTGDDGAPFSEKIEGLRPHPTRAGHVQFVIDTEAIDAARLFEAELNEGWDL